MRERCPIDEALIDNEGRVQEPLEISEEGMKRLASSRLPLVSSRFSRNFTRGNLHGDDRCTRNFAWIARKESGKETIGVESSRYSTREFISKVMTVGRVVGRSRSRSWDIKNGAGCTRCLLFSFEIPKGRGTRRNRKWGRG